MAKNRIGALRREYGMNQKELGNHLDVGQTTVSAWETGKNEPDNESMHKMAQLFQCSIGYLMGYEEETPNRGLTPQEVFNNQFAAERSREAEEWEKQRAYDMHGMTDKEIAELEAQEELSEWLQSDRSMYPEAFQINKLFEYLSDMQRKRVLDIVKMMFPFAVRGEYTDETPRK